MSNRVFTNARFLEYSLFKTILSFEWGLQKKVTLKKEVPECEEDTEESILFLPLFDALRDPLKFQCDYELGKFLLRYSFIDKKQDEKVLDCLKLVLKTNDCEYDSEECILEFPPNSLRHISTQQFEDSKYSEFYFTVAYLPTVKSTESYCSRKMKTVKSKLWSDDPLEQCLNGQLMFRICGIYDCKFDDEFQQEFGPIRNSLKTRFFSLPPKKETLMRNNFFIGMQRIRKVLSKMPFSVHYSIVCLFSLKIIRFLDFSIEDLEKGLAYLLDTCEDDPSQIYCINKALQMYKGSKVSFYDSVKLLVDKNLSESKDTENLRGLISVRRVIVTPSRIEYYFPTLSRPNRVIRKFLDNEENFMRVSFQNDDRSTGKFSLDFNTPILKHIEEIMVKGFVIADKTFKFLHYSNSQMKAHSCWFINETKELQYDDVMESLGCFDSETILSKRAARKGQAFSSAIKVKTLNIDSEIQQIDDIQKGPYVFSDGCGEIHAELAREISHKYFGLLSLDAFQIRMGGYKGVLLSSKNFTEDYKVKVRPSMNKFELNSEDTEVDLEIIRGATYSYGYLNKQIITILWAGGVDSEIFIKMQRDYTDSLLEEIKALDSGSDFSLVKSYSNSVRHINTKIGKVLRSNLKVQRQLEQLEEVKGDNSQRESLQNSLIDLSSDPFIHPLIRGICYNKLDEVRARFRIFDEKSCVLIGVIDPAGCLDEGEIFVQYDRDVLLKNSKGGSPLKFIDPSAKIKKIVEGEVLVTRSPCVHPGDIRKLKAVFKEPLKHYVNVVIFSTKGDRPDQEKMASGDLDGDIYWVNWREEFVQNFTESPPHQPLEERKDTWISEKAYKISENSCLTNVKPYFDDTTSSDEDMSPIKGYSLRFDKTQREKYIDHFIDFIQNDKLGEVANLHCKVANSHRNKIKERTCLDLAHMHSKAVDYQKHGEMFDIVHFGEILGNNRYNVDFMSYKRSLLKSTVIESPGVLGQLFRDFALTLDHNSQIALEYKYRIQCDYPFPSDLLSDPQIFPHLAPLYTLIIKPFTSDLKKIMLSKRLLSESCLYDPNYSFSSITNTRDEMYSHQSELESLLLSLEDRYRLKALKSYKQSLVSKPQSKTLEKAIRFITYFSLANLGDPRLEEVKNNEGFQEFVKEVREDECGTISWEEYLTVMHKTTFVEDYEVERVVRSLKLFSPWWFLTR
ncbi:unnamed protein product [Moneuplotes crassus]|uniref:RNA-dependent RNA polymerase n=1 Tax=Euplotes crassus TaxID=5936 RepID=A0AAD1UHU7_EUPCR|nr:unnamed protein product [Moneuplotes crassus]